MQRQHWRMIVAGGLLAASAAALLLNPSAPFMLRCATGDGFSWVSTQPHDFEADFFGYRWRGNTSNYIDRQVEMYGAYELPVTSPCKTPCSPWQATSPP